MLTFMQKFIDYMDENEIKYSSSGDNVLLVSYEGENMESIPVYLFFDEDDEPYVQLKCWNIVNFKKDENAAFALCNQLNAEYRWLKFYLDEDKDMTAAMDAFLDIETGDEECMFLVRQMVNILDDAYPKIAKARWA